jgi:hypothetical protein
MHALASAMRKSPAADTKATPRGSGPQSIGDQISNAYRTMVDTIKETDRSRNKLESPAVSQTAASRRKFDASFWIRPD